MAVELNAYVNNASGSDICVKVMSDSLEKEMTHLGFVFNSDLKEWRKSVASDNEKAVVFAQLRDLRICFSGGRSWSPAEVFQHLRDRQLLSGEFDEVVWGVPNQPKLRRV